MVDTIGLYLPAHKAGDIDLLAEVPCCLDGKPLQSDDGLVVGRVGNMRVKVRMDGVAVEGSLCKYYLGNNWSTLTRTDICSAVWQLSKALHLSLVDAEVRRVDFATNFVCQYPPVTYYRHLGEMPRATRGLRDTTLTYYKAQEEIEFYDKTVEHKRNRSSKGTPIPEVYAGQNVLRYEWRLLGKRAYGGFLRGVTAKDLWDIDFYKQTLDLWAEGYYNIKHINDMEYSFKSAPSLKVFYQAGVVAFCDRQGGQSAMLQQIDDAARRGELTRQQKKQFRDAVLNAYELPDNVLIQDGQDGELDELVNSTIKHCR